MEWQIMNTDGRHGLSLGSWVDNKYSLSYDCFENLTAIYEKLLEDDPVQRIARRQIATSQIIKKDLIPILTCVEEDTELFSLCVKLLVNLTQPIECLQYVSQPGSSSASSAPWYWDVNKMLKDTKTACTNIKFADCICKEILRILDEAGDYDILDRDCEAIDQCLLLIRNLLHIQDHSHQDVLSDVHMFFLKYLFVSGLDNVLIRLLNVSQTNCWGATVVQLISLLYKDLVSEIFQHLDDRSSCDEESCDSSNCSQCESAMDRPYNTQAYGSKKSQSSSGSSSSQGGCSNKDSRRSAMQVDSDTVVNTQECSARRPSSTTGSSSPLNATFKSSCWISHSSGEDILRYEVCVKRQSQTSAQDSQTGNTDSTGSNSSSTFSVEKLGLHLTEFTTNFLQSGFSSLIGILKKMFTEHQTSPGALDDSYFLWTVALFLKFARRKEIEFKNLKEVFTSDVFGFLVYEAVSNGEEVLNLQKLNKPYNLNMRRLHLSVSALRELLKTLAFHREKGITGEDREFLDNLQRELANMSDLRQLFLWLIRVFEPSCHSTLLLRDVIVTNHYFLLLLEDWISNSFCLDKTLDMLSHVKQFAAGTVMTNYGHLLQNFWKNDHHVNNCIFTMMHHVAGDCLKPESLLQVGILTTFLQIWDTEAPITQEMNDLMEYVIQKFLSMAEDDPLKCAVQLYSTLQDEDTMNTEEVDVDGDTTWTQEEEDKLILWFVELEADPNIVNKLIELFNQNGMKKSKFEIINHLYKMGWMPADKLDAIMKSDKELLSFEKSRDVCCEEESDNNMAILGNLSQLKEEEVVPRCIKKLKEMGYQEHVQQLQNTLLEMAYIKLDKETVKKSHVEEPVLKYFISKCKDAPLVFFNEEEETFGRNIYTMALMDQLGFIVEDESISFRYPRVPKDWTVAELIEKAEILGDIDSDLLKFDLEMARSALPVFTKDDTYIPKRAESNKRSSVLSGVQEMLWMKMVGQYNADTGQSVPNTADNDQLTAGQGWSGPSQRQTSPNIAGKETMTQYNEGQRTSSQYDAEKGLAHPHNTGQGHGTGSSGGNYKVGQGGRPSSTLLYGNRDMDTE